MNLKDISAKIKNTDQSVH